MPTWIRNTVTYTDCFCQQAYDMEVRIIFDLEICIAMIPHQNVPRYTGCLCNRPPVM